MIKSIKEHFKDCYPNEGCGLVIIDKGKKRFLPITNIAESGEAFVMDPKEFITAWSKYNIYAVVHSHPDASPEPSEYDRTVCDSLNIPFIIFSYPSMEMFELYPKNYSLGLIGREYQFGITDCLQACIDYYKTLGLDLRERPEYLDDWWERGINYFTEQHIRSWGFTQVQDMKKNDLLVFQINAPVPNHCGVYLGDDIFYHHAVNRLSCKENLYPTWKKFLTGVYRHNA